MLDIAKKEYQETLKELDEFESLVENSGVARVLSKIDSLDFDIFELQK